MKVLDMNQMADVNGGWFWKKKKRATQVATTPSSPPKSNDSPSDSNKVGNTVEETNAIADDANKKLSITGTVGAIGGWIVSKVVKENSQNVYDRNNKSADWLEENGI